jgi:sugar lactone lactonase YvrE
MDSRSRAGRMRSVRLLAVVAVVAALLPASTAHTSAQVEMVATFDPGAWELPEGVAVDKVGNVYLSMAFLGQLWRLAPGESEPEPVASIHDFDPAGGFGMLGIAVSAPGDVYVAVDSGPADRGVWRYRPDSETFARLPGTEQIQYPNDLSFDSLGNLYVTSSFEGYDGDGAALGALWRIDRNGTVEQWLVSPELGGLGEPPFELRPIGVNGIVHHQRVLYVSSTERARIMAVPIQPDGSPGEMTIVAQDPTLYTADGLAVDVHGRVYVAVIGQSAVRRIEHDGSITTLATHEDGLDFPTTLAFGTGRNQPKTLYAVNFAIGPLFGFPAGAGPALLAISVDTPGMP